MSEEHHVSTMSPTLGQCQRAIALALLMACSCMLTLPLVDVRLPRYEALTLIVDTAFAVFGLVVAALLYLQFRVTRAPAVLALASGCLLMALATSPQLLRESQGASMDLRLLFIADCTLPAAAIAYALLRRGSAIAANSGRAVPHIARAVAATVALAALATWITAASVEPGSAVSSAEASALWRVLATTFLCAALAVAIVMLWQRRSVLDLWLLVTLTAWFIDALLRAASPDDSSVTWHFARIYGLFGICCVMFALLAENVTLFARLERLLRHAEAASIPPRARSAGEAGVVDRVAEELAQPLCAITANADAIDRMLDHDPPDLAEVRAALVDIADDAGRASRTLRDARRSVADS
jgi:intracellular septation protein A